MIGTETQHKVDAEAALPLSTDGEEIAMCFSGGKDSSLALWEIHRARTYRVKTLVTTVNADYDRVSMHGVRRTLLRATGRGHRDSHDGSPGSAGLHQRRL